MGSESACNGMTSSGIHEGSVVHKQEIIIFGPIKEWNLLVFSYIVKTMKDDMLSAISQDQNNKHNMLVGYVETEKSISETEKGGHWRLGRVEEREGKGCSFVPKPLWVRGLSLVFSSSAE